MSILRKASPLLSWAGLLIASSAWIINTQLGEILPYLDCQQQARFSAMASFVGATVACVAGAVSWQSAGRANKSDPLATSAFAGSLSALSAAVFAFCALDAGDSVTGAERMRTIALTSLFVLISASAVLAHGSQSHGAEATWTFDPWIVGPLFVIGSLYAFG